MRIAPLILSLLLSLSATAQQFTVSADKMNVLWIAMDNPVTCVVENVSCKNIVLEVDDETTIKNGDAPCTYILIPKKPGSTTVKIFEKTKAGNRLIGEKEFRRKRIAEPSFALAGAVQGRIRKNILLSQLGPLITGDAAHFGFRFTIDEFKVIILRNNNIVFESLCTGAKFSDSIKEGMQKIKHGDKFICEDIKFSGYGYTRQSAGSIELTVID